MAENHKRSMELEAELEEKRREQERHHEERMQSMMMYFMQQVAGHSTYSPTGFMPMPYSGPYSFPSHSGPPFPNHSNSDHEVHDVVDDDTLLPARANEQGNVNRVCPYIYIYIYVCTKKLSELGI